MLRKACEGTEEQTCTPSATPHFLNYLNMMNFYYDPILGLQYDYLGELFVIDLECIPQDIKFGTDMWMEYVRQIGVYMLEPSSEPCVEIVGQITEHKL